MNYIRRSFVYVLSTFLLITSLFVSTSTTNVYGETNNHTYNGTFLIDTMFSSNKYEYKIKYDDAWFKDNYSYIYNHEISNFLMKAAMATSEGWGAGDDSGLTDLFDKLGYTYTNNIRFNETNDSSDSIVFVDSTADNYDYEDPSKDGIGYGIAHKNVSFDGENYTYIGISIRGMGYATEWGSNFTIGDNKDHYGFKQAASRIEDRLLDYINEIDSSYPIRIWVTGYSRAAAAANILGHYLNEDALDGKLGNTNPEDIFTYTFEAPRGKDSSSTSSEYTYNNHTVNIDDNIFNVINTIDFVPKVAMKEMGFSRYGVDKYYPSCITIPDYYNSTQYKNMIDSYQNILLYDDETSSLAGNVGEYVYQIPNQVSIFNSLSYILSSIFNNDREEYVDDDKSNAQTVARMVFDAREGNKDFTDIVIYYNNGSKKLEIDPSNPSDIDYLEAINFAYPLLKRDVTSDFYIKLTIANQDGSDPVTETVKITNDQFHYLLSVLPEDISDELDRIKSMSLLAIALNINTLKNEITNIIEKYEEIFGDLFDALAYAHYPEASLAWSESNDEIGLFKNVRYNKIEVGNKSDISVYYKDELVSKINKDSDNLNYNGKLEGYLDGKGENSNRVVLVPDDENYRIEISASRNDTLSVKTYNINIEDYVLRKFSKSISSGTYQLVLSKNNVTLNGSKIDDIEVNDDPSDVILGIDYNDSRGITDGDGKYGLYDYASLSAKANTGYEFISWSNEHNNVVSEDCDINYLVKGEENLTANFDPIEYNIIYNLNGGTIDGDNPDSYNIETETFTLINPTKENAIFAGWSTTDTDNLEEEITINQGSMGDKEYEANWIDVSNISEDDIDKYFELVNKYGINNVGIWMSDIDTEITYDPAIKKYMLKFNVYDGEMLLVEGKDYTVSYKNNTKVYYDKQNNVIGKAELTIKGKGNYSGTLDKVATFTIVPKTLEPEMVNKIEPVIANNKAQKLKPTVYVGSKKLTNGTDYTLIYDTDDDYKSDGTHNVTIKGKGNYAGEVKISYEIKPNTYTYVSKLSISLSKSSMDYDGGNELKPIITIKKGKDTIFTGTDETQSDSFDISYSNNRDIGKATVTVSAKEKSSFVGSVSKTYKITGISLSKAKVLINDVPYKAPTFIYDGKEKTIDNMTLTYQKDSKSESKKLTGVLASEYDGSRNVDYIYSYTNNINKGKATITFTGVNGFTGSVKKTFTIKAKALTADDVIVNVDDFEYMKSANKPEVSVTLKDGNKQLTSLDYSVVYSNNTSVTKENTSKLPTVTVKFKGNYSGTLSNIETFNILPGDISKTTITVKDKVYSKSKNAWKSTVTVSDVNNKKLANKTDYTVQYYYDQECENEITDLILEAGTTVYVKVVGNGNYDSSTYNISSYRIVSADIAKASIKINKQLYTGKPITLTSSDITITHSKQPLVLGNDYEIVSYVNNVNKGTATVTIKGINNYGGTKSIKFTIGQRSIKDNFISFIQDIAQTLASLF